MVLEKLFQRKISMLMIQSLVKFEVSFYVEVLTEKERGFSRPIFSVQTHTSPFSVYVKGVVVSGIAV